jgi:hypothetical protein
MFNAVVWRIGRICRTKVFTLLLSRLIWVPFDSKEGEKSLQRSSMEEPQLV